MNITPSTSLNVVEREKVMTPYFGGYNTNAEAVNAGMLGVTINYQNNSRSYTLSLDGVVSAVTVSVSYRDANNANTISNEIVASSLKTDLTDGFAEQILSGSVRFTFGGSTYVDKIGFLYRDPSKTTGAGTLAGQIHYGNGGIEIESWAVGSQNKPVLISLATQLEAVQANQVSFRAPMVPIRAQSLTLSATRVEGDVLNIVPDANGVINTADCDGVFNFEQGYGQFVFREKVVITSENRAEIMTQDWYVAELEYTKDGKQWIHKPIMVLPETIKFSAVGYSYIPIDENLLGLSAVRLPLDGRVPIFRAGEIAIISSSKKQVLNSYVAGTIFQLNDVRLSWCELVDSSGVKLDYDLYTVDHDYGRVTLSGDFIPGNLTMPLIADYRYQDMRLIQTVKINGELTFTKPLSHNYDPLDTIIGSTLVIGDMQARYTNLFEQETWNNIWSDVPKGAAISARYNDTLYPIQLTNKGAAQERWAIVFTSAEAFRCYGEISGQLIDTGVITSDYVPINPATNAPYFVIKKEGWGAGWRSGYTVRFDTVGANFPIWVIRTTKQSEPTVLSDNFQIMLRGDNDRTT